MNSALMHRAVALQDAGQFSEAEKAFQDILKIEPLHFGALYSLGLVYMQTGQFEACASLLTDAVRVNPQFPNAWFVRGASLLRLGRWTEALACLDQAVAFKPDFLDAMSARATALREMDRLPEALLTCDRLLALRPDDARDWHARGLVLVAMHRLDEALASLDRAIFLAPGFPDALADRATIYLQLKRFDEALAGFDAVLAGDPENVIAWNNRGNVFLAMERFDEALAHYDRALAIRADFELALSNRGQALLGLGRATRVPAPFLRRTFDEVAPKFEQAMANLSYRAHLDLRVLASQVLPPDAASFRILDLGAGTGLVGDAFKDLAKGGRLDGVDLSPRMIEEARKRGIYNRLILGDVETVLASPMPLYDLILAADTMIYIGNVALCFDGVVKCLANGGYFVFSVEKKEGEGWEQTSANRFRHSESYLREEGARTGLAFADLLQCTLRYEAGQPVAGLAMAFRKPARS